MAEHHLKEEAVPFVTTNVDQGEKETKKSQVPAYKNWKAHLGNIVSFVILTFQTAAVVLLMRYSRLQHHANGEPSFAITVAVTLGETGKCLVGIIVTLYQIANNDSRPKQSSIFTELKNQVFSDRITVLKMSIPAILYMIQNNLLFTALQHLDAAFYQIIYQLKMFSAAILATIMIKRKYTKIQWISFACVAFGAVLANLSVVEVNIDTDQDDEERNEIIGIICVLCACFTSGFSGVFMEIQLKGAKHSLFVKNIQLAMFGALSCLVNMYLTGDWEQIVLPYGVTHGFTSTVWAVVALNIMGGYIVAYVIKYIENIAKAFASTTALIFIVGGSWCFFGTQLTSIFWVGFLLVIIGNMLFNHKVLFNASNS